MASANAAYLASRLPGMCVDVADAWLRAEGGGPGRNNPLNITRTGSGLDESYTTGPGLHFANYPSVQVGLQAAAWLVMHGNYAGIRSALGTGNCALEAQAIINSPWAAGHYGGSANRTGPLQQIAFGGSSSSGGAVDATEAVAGGGSGYTPGQVIHPNVADFLSIDQGQAFTSTIAAQAAAKYAKTNGGTYGPAYQGAYNSILTALAVWEKPGVTAGQVPFNVDSSGHNTGDVVVPTPDQLASGETKRGDITSVLPDFLGIGAALAIDVGLVALILLLGYKGLTELLA